jgi:hypothetical protein
VPSASGHFSRRCGHKQQWASCRIITSKMYASPVREPACECTVCTSSNLWSSSHCAVTACPQRWPGALADARSNSSAELGRSSESFIMLIDVLVGQHSSRVRPVLPRKMCSARACTALTADVHKHYKRCASQEALQQAQVAFHSHIRALCSLPRCSESLCAERRRCFGIFALRI